MEISVLHGCVRSHLDFENDITILDCLYTRNELGARFTCSQNDGMANTGMVVGEALCMVLTPLLYTYLDTFINTAACFQSHLPSLP